MFPLMRTKNDHSPAVFARDPGSGKKAAEAVYFIHLHVGAVLAEENHVIPVQCLTRRTMADIETKSQRC